MGAKNKCVVFPNRRAFEAYKEELRHFTRVFMMDHVTIALGRMGFREAKFRELDKTLTEVVKEYEHDYEEDLKVDKEMVYSLDCLDRELKQYTGALFVPYEQRYK